jgi:hypothetical protein
MMCVNSGVQIAVVCCVWGCVWQWSADSGCVFCVGLCVTVQCRQRLCVVCGAVCDSAVQTAVVCFVWGWWWFVVYITSEVYSLSVSWSWLVLYLIIGFLIFGPCT